MRGTPEALRRPCEVQDAPATSQNKRDRWQYISPAFIDDLFSQPMDSAAPSSLLPEAASDPVAAVRDGLPHAALERVREALGAPDVLLARALGVSERTLYRRRKEEGRLTPEESDRLLLLAETVELATEALDDPTEAQRWLREPHSLLAGESPLEHMDTVAGIQEVHTMLLHIEHSMPA